MGRNGGGRARAPLTPLRWSCFQSASPRRGPAETHELLVGLEEVRILEVARAADGRLHVAIETTEDVASCGVCGSRARGKDRSSGGPSVGRLLRTHVGKHHVELHDYVDARIAVLDRMHTKRLPAYASLGFDTPKRPRERRPAAATRATAMPSDDELDELIEQITVDAYGDEGHWSFLQAIEDDARFPFTASLVGTPVVVTGIDFDGDERRGLVATVERDRTSATISILDLDFAATEQPVTRIFAAYRHWLGIT